MQVVYGFLELKTHAKVAMVVRREGRELRSYVHFGTGESVCVTAFAEGGVTGANVAIANPRSWRTTRL